MRMTIQPNTPEERAMLVQCGDMETEDRNG